MTPHSTRFRPLFSASPEPAGGIGAGRTPPPAGSGAFGLDFVLFAIGAASVLGQVVLFREWMAAGYGVELICILALGVWMIFNAAGVLLAGAGRCPDLATGVFLAALWLLADVLFIRFFRSWTGFPPGTYLPLTLLLPALIVTFSPLCLLLGMAFQQAADRGDLCGRSLAGAYAVECSGSVFGGLLSALLLAGGVQNLSQAFICAGILTAAAIPAGKRVHGPPRFGVVPGVFRGVLFGFLGAGLIFSGKLDSAMARRLHPDLIQSMDSAYGRLTVTRSAGQTVLFQNDVLIADSQSTAAEELVHLSFLEHADPRKILILEGAAEGLVMEAARHRPDRIDLVEIDPVLMAMTRRYLPENLPASGSSGIIRTHVEDPRRFLRSAGSFDIILSACTEPSTALANRFFTRSFFEECASRLAEGGILGFRLNASENFWAPAPAYRNAAVSAALSSVFPHVLVLPGSVSIILASRSPLATDPQILADRFRNRDLSTRLVTPLYLNYVLTNDRRAEIARMLSGMSVPPNTDERPICHLLTLWIWLSRLIPSLIHRNVFSGIQTGIGVSVAVLVLTLFLVGAAMRRSGPKNEFPAYAAVGMAGFFGMAMEGAVMLQYQSRCGALYQNMGILFTAVMLGLTAGAAAMLKFMRSAPNRFSSRFTDSLPLLLPAAVCAGWAAVPRQAGGAYFIFTAFLLAAAGWVVSVLFTRYAFPLNHPRSLYAADVAGGGVAALVCGTLLFPLLGLNRTVLWLAGISIAAAVGRIGRRR